MNDDLIVSGMDGAVGSIAMDNGEYKIMTSNGLSTIGPITSSTTIPSGMYTTSTINVASFFNMDDFLEKHIMNRVTVDHKVQEQELMKLKEHAPDYANEIKENIAKNCSRDMVKKLTFTKRHDKDADVHHFIGRVWMFTEDELKNLINEARNA